MVQQLNATAKSQKNTIAQLYITSAMQGIFGASLRDVVVMQHCLCVMCIYWSKLPTATKVIERLPLCFVVE